MSQAAPPAFSAIRWLLVGSVCAFAPAVGCSDDATSSVEPPRTPSAGSDGCAKSATATKGFLAKQPATIKGNKRTYDLFVGEAHDGKTPLPLVFVFHGTGGSGANIRQSYALENEAAGKAIFVYPDADPTLREWDLDSKADKNLDIAFFDAVRSEVAGKYCIDTKRVFATGFSAGAYFSNQLACRRGSVLRAVASHGGGGPFGDNDEYGDDGELECPERPIAALITHGVDDATVKLEEGQKSLQHWRNVNACKSGSGTSFDPPPCSALADCAEDRPVVYCEIPGLGHSLWKSGAKTTWSFFSSR